MTLKFLPFDNLQDIFDKLTQVGFSISGPIFSQKKISYAPITKTTQLPWGVIQDTNSSTQAYKTDENLKQCFKWIKAVGSAKPYLFKQDVTLWKALKNEDTGKIEFVEENQAAKPHAIFGLRSCDIQAIKIQDTVFLNGKHVDNIYKEYREKLFVIGVNCTAASNTCFCASVKLGPEINPDRQVAELILTEIENGFIVEYYSDKADEILDISTLDDALESQIQVSTDAKKQALTQQKSIPSREIRADKIPASKNNHDLWNEFMQTCTSCGGCTQVCPTCFCHKTEELPSFDFEESEHLRMWDSCFSQDHGYTSGINHRPDLMSRYQMWLNHKFAEWSTQFGEDGCVGCGRCIDICPMDIDVTAGINKLCEKA